MTPNVMPHPRYAIYYTPPPESPLNRFGCGVLGYDCFDAAEVPRRVISGIDPVRLAQITAEPRRYGFHATLTAPFHLGKGDEGELTAAFTQFASRHRAPPLGPLEAVAMGAFIVLRPVDTHSQLEELAADCVTTFHDFRAPPAQSERERRLAAGLSARQAELLDRWGYPYVLDQFRFHMTLAGPVPENEREAVRAALATAFEPIAKDDHEIGAVSLMVQADPAAAFRVLSRPRLTAR